MAATQLGLLVTLVLAAVSVATAAHVAPIYNGTTPQTKAGTIPGIAYNGGPVMTTPVKLYFIWYGTSDFTATQKAILRGVAASFSPSSDAANTVQKWWGIDREYYDSTNTHVTGTVTLAGEYIDSSASQGTSLTCSGTTTNKVFDVVKHAITAGAFPVDSTALYVIFGNTGISQSGTPGCDNTAGNLCSDSFCNQYCGWHDSISYSGSDIKYTFIGNPSSCLNGCAPPSNQASSPNNDPAIDAMVSTFSHELAETASDPDLNAWTDSNGENADKCAYTYGTTFTSTTGGGSYNLVGANGKQYMIQQNWDITTGSCKATSSVVYTTPAPGGTPAPPAPTTASTPAPPAPTTKAPTPGPTTAPATPGPTSASGTPALLINEFWVDQPSYDYAEFIEIKNTGATAVQLSGYTLSLYNSADTQYNTITLPSYSLAAGGYYVVCCPAYTTSLNTFTSTSSCQLTWASDGQACTGGTTGECNLIRNSYYGSIALKSPSGTTVDSVSFGTSSGSPTWTEPRGSGGSNYATQSGSSGSTAARCPDGKYTTPNGNNHLDFSAVATPTPGASNTGHC